MNDLDTIQAAMDTIDRVKALRRKLRDTLAKMETDMGAHLDEGWPFREVVKWAQQEQVWAPKVMQTFNALQAIEVVLTAHGFLLPASTSAEPCDEDGVPL